MIAKRLKIKEYQPIILNEIIEYKCLFISDGIQTYCNFSHLLYEPCLIGITFPKIIKSNRNFEKGVLKIYNFNDKENCSLTIVLDRIIRLKEEIIYIYSIKYVYLNLSIFKKIYLKYIYEKGLKSNKNFIVNYNYLVYKKLVALFSIPKKVWLLSIKLAEQKNNINFPIDLCAKMKYHVIFGVRNSNRAINKIKIGFRFHICTASAEDLSNIYNMGNYTSVKNNNQNSVKIDQSKIGIPDVICDYYEIELLNVIDYKFQKLYITKIISKNILDNGKHAFYHIHKIWYQSFANKNSFKLIRET